MNSILPLETLLKKPDLLYRLFGIAGAAMMVPARWVFPEEMHDPMYMRWIISGLLLTMSLVTFSEKIRNKFLDPMATISVLAITLWVFYLLYWNGLDPAYTTTYVLLTLASFWFLPQERLLAYYLIFNLVGLTFISLTVPDPVAPVWHLWVHAGFVQFIGLIADRSRSMNLRKIYSRAEEIDYINYSAVGASRDGILLVDNDGNYLRANDNFLNLWGLEKDKDGNLPLDAAQEDALKMVKDKVRFAELVNASKYDLEENQIEEFELIDGRFLEIYFIKTHMGSKPIGRLWFFRDITDRKRMENSLKQSEKRLRQLNDSLTEMAGNPALLDGVLETSLQVVTRTVSEILHAEMAAVWFMDFKDRSMVCQAHYQKSSQTFQSGQKMLMDNYPAYFDLITNKRIFSVHDTRAHPIAEEFRKGKYTGSAGALVHTHIRSGDEILGILSVEEPEPRVWKVEELSYIASLADLFAVSIEINRRKEIRQQLERYSAILKATFELSETGILVLDHAGNVIECNDLYLKTWKMTRDFLLHGSYEEKVQFNLSQIENAEDVGRDAKMLRERPGMETAGLIRFKDGRVIERYSKGLVIGGEIVGRVWFYLDITERKEREKELMNRNFELDSFVYRASHDLKAPLNSIMGLINIIREEKDVDSILQYITMMDKSVSKLDAFIKQLTQFSQDTRLQIVRMPINLEELLQEVWTDLKYMDNANRMELDLQVAQDGQFFSDPVRLAIVCNNIISNAIKYQDLKKGKSRIEVLVQADEKRAVIQFRDNGLGISQEHLEKVFELFFRASVQATGSGLGLYITYNAVGKLGGKIDVDSELGIGTTFTLNIPNRLSEEVEENQSSAHAS